MTTKPNGAILYCGPSLLDGSPIIVVITGLSGRSTNTKTGKMAQTWILRRIYIRSRRFDLERIRASAELAGIGAKMGGIDRVTSM